MRYFKIMIRDAPEDSLDDASEDSLEEDLDILTICHD